MEGSSSTASCPHRSWYPTDYGSDHEAELAQAQLERLRAALGKNGRAAAGPEQVLRCLQERRVETLLFAQGLRDDRVEEAIRAALDQGAAVLPVSTPDLGPMGGIAALLRF